MPLARLRARELLAVNGPASLVVEGGRNHAGGPMAAMQAGGLTHLASNDADFDRVPWITRYAPA